MKLMTPLRIASIIVSFVLIGACGRSGTTPGSETSQGKLAGGVPSRPIQAQPSSASTPSSVSVRRAAACSYISRTEMAEMLGAPIGKPSADEETQGATSCVYPPADAGSSSQAEVTIEWEHGDAPSFERLLVSAFGGSALGRQVAHNIRLGDEASYSSEGVLSARTGKTLVTITLPMRPDSEAKALAIGRKLFERLGAATAPEAAGEEPVRGSDRATSDPADAAPAAPVLPNFPDGLSVGEECPAASGDAPDGETAIVPLKVGLTLSHVWFDSTGDYEHECLIQVTAVTRSYIDVTESCPVGKDRRTIVWKRRLCSGDLRDAYFYRTEASEAVPRVVSPTTMFSLSQRSFQELKSTGNTRHRYIQIYNGWRRKAQPLEEDTDGTLHSGPSDREPYKIIVNDRQVELPTIVGVTNRGTPNQTTAKVLDDARFPLVLDYDRPGTGFRIRFARISYPTGSELEKQLAVEKHVDVYGIYFDFASDRLRPESTPVLSEIAGVLANNAGWTLTINGHTDNIGGDASNLELSRRRSESVRRALVEQYHINAARLITAGFGASQPKESNATADGRGKNRRVELVRQ
jgi:outer membrane protein OmpA-like peptidoglycan-associated protein